MKEILINTREIESAIEKNDVCIVRMKSGQTWVCQKEIDVIVGIHCNGTMQSGYTTSTLEYLLNQKDKNIFIPLATKGKSE